MTDHMDVDEFNARNAAGDWDTPWDPEAKRLGAPMRSDPIKSDRHPVGPVDRQGDGSYKLKGAPVEKWVEPEPVGPRVSMSPGFDKGRKLFRVVIAAEVLSTNKLYANSWSPAGKATLTPKVGSVCRCLSGGRFMPVRPRRVRTTEHKEWKKGVVRQLQASTTAIPGCIPPGTEVFVRIYVHGDWRTMDLKKIRKRDLGNCEKALLDTLFEHLRVDDSVIFTLYMAKVEDRMSAFTIDVGTLVPKFGVVA